MRDVVAIYIWRHEEMFENQKPTLGNLERRPHIKSLQVVTSNPQILGRRFSNLKTNYGNAEAGHS